MTTPDDDETQRGQRDEGARDEGPRDEGEREAREKKERVLHTRVPAVLEQELKRLATNLKMPVSNLVRAILEDAIDAVDAVGQRAEGELQGIAQRLHEQRDALRARAAKGPATREPDDAAPTTPAIGCPEAGPDLAGVIGFQSLTLIADAACTVCGRSLPKGTRACRGVREEPGPRVLLGPECRWVPDEQESGT